MPKPVNQDAQAILNKRQRHLAILAAFLSQIPPNFAPVF
jgi:hypothetical protein